MDQQDLVWVRFPFSNLEESKVRPAVIISNNAYNKKKQDVLICAITSNLEEEAYSILIDRSNLKSGNLPIKSKIRADKIILLEKRRIIKAFAMLDDSTFDKLIDEIIKLARRHDDKLA